MATYFAGTLPADPYFEDNDDLILLQQALLEVYSDEEPIDYGDSPIDVGASGTALRFVAAVCASSPGADYVITGTPRLMERPMTPLIDLLKEAGAGIEAMGESRHGPYRVKGGKIKGGEFSIRGDVSSQFISAVMLASPTWEHGLILSFTTPLVSRPYVEMTAKLMERFGVKVHLESDRVIVEHGSYREPFHFEVEADWSGASFFYEAAAIGAKELSLPHLTSPEKSLQGDAAASELFKRLGVNSKFDKEGAQLTGSPDLPEGKIELDFSDFPDLVLPFAVAALCRGVKFKITGIGHLRHKESDRIESLTAESRKLGFEVKSGPDFIYWDGETTEAEETPVIEPHDDHRVAMSFAMAALKTGAIKITHPRVVEKSFIDFWNQLPQLGLECKEENDVMTVTCMELPKKH